MMLSSPKLGGLILISASWKILYQAAKSQTIAKIGPYKYIRHPQYVGFVIIILGFLMQWPTLPTLIMAPVLIVMYLKLAWREEKEVILKYPQYKSYLQDTPAFIPSLKKILTLASVRGKV